MLYNFFMEKSVERFSRATREVFLETSKKMMEKMDRKERRSFRKNRREEEKLHKENSEGITYFLDGEEVHWIRQPE